MGTGFQYLSLESFGLAWMTHMLVGMVWYAPRIFGDLCGQLAFGKKPVPKPDARAILATVVGGAMGVFFFVVILNAANCMSALEGALWGLAIGLFFNSGMNASHCFFEDRPFGLFAIHRGCHAVSLTVIGAFLGKLCGGSVQ